MNSNQNLNSARRWVAALLIIGVTATVLRAGSAHATIVQNPSFESPAWNTYNANGYIAGVAGGGSDPVTVDNWTYYRVDTAEGVGLGTPGAVAGWWNMPPNLLPASNGTQFAFVQKTGSALPSIAQDIPLTAGINILSFWVTGAAGTGGNGDATYEVQLDGSTLLTGSTVDHTAWSQVTTSFSVPADGTYTLKFLNTTSASGNHAFLLDNVNVEIIPEPATLWLLGVGGWLVWRRARR